MPHGVKFEGGDCGVDLSLKDTESNNDALACHRLKYNHHLIKGSLQCDWWRLIETSRGVSL